MDLFLASNLFVILKSLNAILVAGLIIIGLRKLQNRPQKITFTATVLFFFFSTLFFNEEGILSDWLKHGFFYIGQLFFSLFLYYIIRFYFEKREREESSQREHTGTPQTPPPTGSETRPEGRSSVPSMMAAGFGMDTINWFVFLTEQGINDIIALPIFFLIVIIVRVQYLSIESTHFKKALNFFLYAAASLLMIHIGEFFIENQKFILPLVDKSELIKFLWFYVGILFFYLGMKKLSDPIIQQR